MTKLPIMALLAGSLLVGLSFAVLLPPFEGFDETAHYSYIQQIAETATAPRLNDPMSAEVQEYLKVAPSALSLHSAWSYEAFFKAPADVIDAGRAAALAPRDRLRPWRVSETPSGNWEGQHPPLYYLILAPAFNLSNGMSLQRQLVLLRGLSYLIAWIGLCIVACSSWINAEKGAMLRTATVLAPALWPALLPMWFAEMARLGNDSLVALWVACAAVLIPRLRRSCAGILDYLALGTVCGLGLLTKITFLPLAAAIGFFFLYRVWSARSDGPEFRRRLRGLAVFIVAIVLIAGWWYGRNLYDMGTLTGSNNDAELQKKGEMLGLLMHNLRNTPTSIVIGGLIGTGLSFLWNGTWSFVFPPVASELPIALMVLLVIAGYLHSVVRAPLKNSEWIPLLALLLFVAGLFQQMVIFAATYAVFSIGAWYLHSYAPIFAPIMGRGVAEMARWRRARPLLGCLLVYPLIFLPFATGMLALYFGGCGGMNPGRVTHNFASAMACMSDVTRIYQNLEILGDPQLAIGLFIAGWALMLVGLFLALRMLVSEVPPPTTLQHCAVDT